MVLLESFAIIILKQFLKMDNWNVSETPQLAQACDISMVFVYNGFYNTIKAFKLVILLKVKFDIQVNAYYLSFCVDLLLNLLQRDIFLIYTSDIYYAALEFKAVLVFISAI